MEPPKKRPTNAAFPHRVALYENDEGMRLLEELAQRRGQTATSLLRALIREEAERKGITAGPK